MATIQNNQTPTFTIPINLGNPNPYSGQNHIDSLLKGTKWGNGPVRTGVQGLEYSFMENPPLLLPLYSFGNVIPTGTTQQQFLQNFSPITKKQRVAAIAALDAWADVANITYTPIQTETSQIINGTQITQVGDIRFGRSRQVNDANTATTIYRPGNPENGDIWFSSVNVASSTPTITIDPYEITPDDATENIFRNTYAYSTFVHEIGHALGLKHPGDYNAGGGNTPGPFLPVAEDNYQYSLMSYNLTDDPNDPTNRRADGTPWQPYTGTDGNIYPSTPLIYDIEAIQYLYGANNNTRLGDDTYSWDPQRAFIEAIWDAGGNDTISAANQTLGTVIDLTVNVNGQPIHFSSIGPKGNFWSVKATNNLAIAFGVTIENATGGGGDDELIGNAVANVLNGGFGIDTMRGKQGDDTYYVDNIGDTVIELANEGTDIVFSSATYSLSDNVENLTLTGNSAINGTGNSLENLIIGNNNDNNLYGGYGNDTLFGGDGNDKLVGGAGADTLIGDDGIDTASYDTSGAGVFVDLTTGKGNRGDAEGDILQTIENLEGSQQADTLIGDARSNKLSGLGGDDILYGNAGNDTLNGDNGNDKLFGQDGDDILNDPDGVLEAQGGIDNDIINITFASSWDDNNNSNDSPRSDGKIIGGYGDDTITITMNRSDFFISLKADEDNNETPQDGNDTVTLQGNYASSIIYLGGGANTFNGGLGKDTAFGGSGNDTLFGNAGDDLLIGGTGTNQIDGGSGNDTIDYQNLSNAVTVNIDEKINYKNVGSPFDPEKSFEITSGRAFDEPKTTIDTLKNIENIVASRFNDVLIGNSLDNKIFAGVGDDLLIGNAGNDLLDGGDGIDTVSYRRDPGRVLVNLEQNTATDGFGGIDQLFNFENVAGSAFSDRIIGNDKINILFGDAGDDVIEGRGGSDIIYGNDGKDSLLGENGDDKLIGGVGADTLNGGDGNNTASYITAVTGVIANLTTPQENTGDASGDVFQLIQNLEGSEINDTLIGDSQNNTLWGLAGADSMFGSFGDDTYFVDNAGDTVTEFFNQGIDLVNSAINYSLGTNVENLNLLEGTAALNGTGNELDNVINGNSANNIIDGGAGNDKLYGFVGSDTIFGGEGNDWIVGGAGNDILTGGNGIDSFVYNSVTDAGDMIKDFTVGSDKIVLTDIVNSSGFRGFNPLNDGFFSFRQASSGMTTMLIDPDGRAGNSFRPAPFILFNNVSATALNNSSNFVF